MKQYLAALVTVTALLACGSPAFAQSEGYVAGAGGNPPPLLEVTGDGSLVYGGDVSYQCESVGSGIVGPAANSSRATRSELERTNERAIRLCTEAGFPPAGTRDAALSETGGASLATLAVLGTATGFVLMRRTVR